MTQHIENPEPIRAGQPRQHEQPAQRDEQPAKDDEQEQENDKEQQDKLDEAIEMTFPASDPISI